MPSLLPGRTHRGPLSFGPAASPRQDQNGKPFTNWGEARTRTIGVTYASEYAALNALLPDGYRVDETVEASILFENMELRNLPWLNGRGYNTWGVYINNVVCTRVTPSITASYMALLFESFTDPITTGREELGFCKVWAEMPDGATVDGKWIQTASWFGEEFMRLTIPNLKDRPVETSPAFKPRPWTNPQTDGILHQRYIPAVGQPGVSDAYYATLMNAPTGSAPPVVLEYKTVDPSKFDEVKLDILEDATWEKLPTLWNIVQGLQKVPRVAVREVAINLIAGASDCSGNKRDRKSVV